MDSSATSASSGDDQGNNRDGKRKNRNNGNSNIRNNESNSTTEGNYRDGDSNKLKSAKTGRKGDPRMHRAVAARLSDPTVSLYDALVIGGFQYTADDDCNLVDNDNVTLGQRKNQLSRRVRLARQHQLSSNGTTNSTTEEKTAQPAKKHPVLTNLKGSRKAQFRRGEKHQKHGQQNPSDFQTTEKGEGCEKNKRIKKEGDDFLSDEDDDVTDCQDGSESIMDDEETPAARQKLLAKNHPGYHPIVIPPLLTCIVGGKQIQHQQKPAQHENQNQTDPTVMAAKNGNGGGKWTSFRGSQPEQQQLQHRQNNGQQQNDGAVTMGPRHNQISGKIARIAGAEPTSGDDCSADRIESPPTVHDANNAVDRNNNFMSATAGVHTGGITSIEEKKDVNIATGSGHPSSAVGAASSTSSSLGIGVGVNNPIDATATANSLLYNISTTTGVAALASLAQSAASVGMTLEQFALTLQNCRNLHQILFLMGTNIGGSIGGSSGVNSGVGGTNTSINQARQDLALALYQSENLALYQRAMLLTGYPADLALYEGSSVASTEYVQLALACWKAEGQRLYKLVGAYQQQQQQQQQLHQQQQQQQQQQNQLQQYQRQQPLDSNNQQIPKRIFPFF